MAENIYEKMEKLTFDEINVFVRNNKEIEAQYHKPTKDLTLNDLRKIQAQYFTPKRETEGLPLLDSARYMIRLGCRSALNLDGGGSSTLWICGQVVNETVGDGKESESRHPQRPVAEAIVFTEVP